MEPFFELRIYEVYPNKMSDWVEFMNKEIIPFQEERGMEINGTFIMNSSDQFFEESGERKMHSEKNGRENRAGARAANPYFLGKGLAQG